MTGVLNLSRVDRASRRQWFDFRVCIRVEGFTAAILGSNKGNSSITA